MSTGKDPKTGRNGQPAGKRQANVKRDERLSDALRANLAKRKQQARARDGKAGGSGTGDKSEPS